MRIRIAILGCGSITSLRHAPEIVKDDRCELAGVYDWQPQRALAIAEKYGCRAYDSAEELIGDSSVDAVYVCTVNTTHAQMAVAALNAGKHVMCEKPMAVTVDECRDMLSAAKRAGRVLMVGHDMRFHPANVLARDILASGQLGKPITIRSSVKHAGPDNWSIDKGKHTWFFKKEQAAFGAMGDVGVHKMDLIRFFLDDDFERITALTGTLQKTDETGALITVEDNASCLFVTKNGVQGVMEASWCDYGSADMSTDILCEQGRLKIQMDDEYPVVVERRDGTRSYMTCPPAASSGVTAHFVATILEGAGNPNMGASGAKTVASVVACIQSAQTGQWVTVDNAVG